ncbi:MAG: class 1 fructose-bisphosphatase [Actinomycetota bacterium]|nr:class 1 fructose-bisphosphatase [Actinomycetota bacterium]
MTAGTALATALANWCGSDPMRSAIAAVINQFAETGTQVAELIAASPLNQTQAPRGPINASGDEQKALDVQAEELFISALATCQVAAVGSEETEEAIILNPTGALVVALDPIDGSSNLDINAPIGTIFSVLPTTGFKDDPAGALLQSGRHQVAAGAIVYGPSTVMAVTWGSGTDIFAFDPATKVFIQTHKQLDLVADACEYAVNASNARHWSPGIRAYVADLVGGAHGPREKDFNMRWLACLVAETYRILLRGGIYLYPDDKRPAYAQGRLRLVYEANPVAFLCEQAGGLATNGIDPILDLVPTYLHQRTPLVFGSRNKVDRVRRYLLNPSTIQQDAPLFAQRGLLRK